MFEIYFLDGFRELTVSVSLDVGLELFKSCTDDGCDFELITGS